FFYSLSRRKTSLLSSFFPYTTLFRSHRPSFFNVENVVNLVRHDIIYSGGGIKTSNGVYFSNKKPVTWCSRIRPIFVLRLIHNRRAGLYSLPASFTDEQQCCAPEETRYGERHERSLRFEVCHQHKSNQYWRSDRSQPADADCHA